MTEVTSDWLAQPSFCPLHPIQATCPTASVINAHLGLIYECRRLWGTSRHRYHLQYISNVAAIFKIKFLHSKRNTALSAAVPKSSVTSVWAEKVSSRRHPTVSSWHPKSCDHRNEHFQWCCVHTGREGTSIHCLMEFLRRNICRAGDLAQRFKDLSSITGTKIKKGKQCTRKPRVMACGLHMSLKSMTCTPWQVACHCSGPRCLCVTQGCVVWAAGPGQEDPSCQGVFWAVIMQKGRGPPQQEAWELVTLIKCSK